MKKALTFASAVLIAVLSFTGCDNTLISNQDIVFPDSLVSFQKHVYPFLRLTCSYQGCHSDESQAGQRRITDWFSVTDQTMNAMLVVPYKPDISELVLLIEFKRDHIYNFQWKITENQKKGIRKWIVEGAKFN